MKVRMQKMPAVIWLHVCGRSSLWWTSSSFCGAEENTRSGLNIVTFRQLISITEKKGVFSKLRGKQLVGSAFWVDDFNSGPLFMWKGNQRLTDEKVAWLCVDLGSGFSSASCLSGARGGAGAAGAAGPPYLVSGQSSSRRREYFL